ncbi:Peptidoglycan/LPS O-acetylase OafA/YrhL, contains acyltransferase and SGNH-hydrolase domains [Lentzea fradiae]|uniref:Peptidoglycan/LPS O-acetylase OafA/YrhL, contains acyltransferase and SGNH-hydrolase domains n=1 Tax=Lentzea fradiae TaxID=200378 RepID=A0A1G7X5R9_9PSEU|nr:acyltransferase family protein [Lentzea fradiae]SDG79477.1 Peptidoglycan/LPS O-acetylase OafA/YrhL, contains acyltransferase and SGNH-hydrolase domains [Lentzea fradiae]
MSTTVQTRVAQARKLLGTGNRTPKAPGFRADVQALRAIAVLAVVVNHFWPGVLTGGYVGVDVFFVISGFLITSHLGREIARTGRVRFGTFYARRIRRLMPAALLVLAVSVVLAGVLLPYPRWSATAWETFASAFYWENWLLAAKSVNYSAQNASASVVQHFWSLSVEEQFYLFWPLLLVGLVSLGRNLRWLVPGVAAVGVLSLVVSVVHTALSPNPAYFNTFARVWEFALGAFVALLASKLVLPRVLAEVAAGVGFVLILVPAFVYDHTTPFPGSLALVPTIGTALVIVSGLRPGPQWHTPVTASAPVQFIGNISYSLYLWHWPVVVLAPFVLGGSLDGGKLTTAWLLWLLALSVVLAWLTKMLVEDRARTFAPLVRNTKTTFAAMFAGLLVVEVLAGGLQAGYHQRVAAAGREVPQEIKITGCHGAAAMIAENNCADPFGPARVTEMGPANEYWHPAPECEVTDRFKVGDKRTMSVCDFSGDGKPTQTVWLLGDSHAEQWQPAVFEVARKEKWLLKVGILGGCPFADVQFSGYRAPGGMADIMSCYEWKAQVVPAVTDDRPSMVLMSFFSRQEFVEDGSGRSQTEQYRTGLEPWWQAWTDTGTRVFVIADPPYNRDVRSTDCATLNASNPKACAMPRDKAHPPDPLTEVAKSTSNPRVSLIDLTNYFCDRELCYSVIGNVTVYFDGDHINKEYSRTLTPMIEQALSSR